MKTFPFNRTGLFLLALLMSQAAFSGDYDPETIKRSAADILPADTLQGEHYTIVDEVEVSGFMNYFVVDSDYGQFTAVGNFNLERLLREIDAIAELKKMTSAGVGTDAVVGVVTDTGKSVGALVTNPVGTVKNVGQGVSRLFKRTKKTTQDVGQQVSQDDSGAEGEAGEEGADPGAEEGQAQPGVGTSVASSVLGIGRAHRKIAQELGVDPYSDNQVLQEELNRVAKISGSVGKVGKILMPIPSAVGTATSVSNMVWGLSPVDLLIQNHETLEALGYDEPLIEAFFTNKYYSPTEQTMVVAAIQTLDQVENRKILIESASAVESKIEGEFMVWSILFAEYYQEQVGPLKEFVMSPTGYIPIMITESGTSVVFAALDHLLWTEGVEKTLAEMASLMEKSGGGQERLLWLEGQFSSLASENLAAAGWVEKSGGFGRGPAVMEE